jgi:drug/metabolite transporter (DMT)-like permease
VVTAILAGWIIGERLEGRVVGLSLAFAGALLVVSGGRSVETTLALPSTRGDALTLLSTGTWALYTVYGRGFTVGRHPPLITAHLLAVAGLLFGPAFILREGWRELATLSATGWLCIGYLGLGCSGLAFLLYGAALEKLEASQIAAFIYLEPLVAQVLGVMLMDEPLSAAALAGGGAILTGVYLVTRPQGASP